MIENRIEIHNKVISENQQCYMIAEMSGNHNGSYDRAKEIIYAAKEAGADAVKLQTYTADTLTLKTNNPLFRTGKGLWEGRTLYDLYEEAYTPWEWQPKLKEYADSIGMTLFSSPFDLSSVDFLEGIGVPAYKIASSEINDIHLLKYVARQGKPVIISTGNADLGMIEKAVNTCIKEGNDKIILLKCTASYPAKYDTMNLHTIRNMKEVFGCLIGLSDHSLNDEVAIAAVAVGAKVIEKHFTLDRDDGGVDSAFSMEPQEFREMVRRIRNVESALGTIDYSYNPIMENGRKKGRSLFVSKPIKKGEKFTLDNIKSIRPGNGLSTEYTEEILGKVAMRDLEYATPLSVGDIDWTGK